MAEIIHLDKDTADIIKTHLPNKIVCNKLAYFYSIFSDSTRIKIITTLLISELCVNDLSTILNLNQTTVSHQLKILKSNGVVSIRKTNKFTFYKVSDKFAKTIMNNGFDYIIYNSIKKVV